MTNLLLTMMDGAGVHVDTLGDSTGRLLLAALDFVIARQRRSTARGVCSRVAKLQCSFARARITSRSSAST